MASLPSADVIQTLLLQYLDQNESIQDSRGLKLGATEQGEVTIDAKTDDQTALQGVLNSLQGKEMVAYTQHTLDTDVLTAEGQLIVTSGSHEYRVWSSLPSSTSPSGGGELKGLSMQELEQKLGKETVKIGRNKAFQMKWMSKTKDGGFVKAVDSVRDETRENLSKIAEGQQYQLDPKILAEFRKRTLCEKKKLIYFSVEKGPNFSTSVEKLETDLTPELIQSGAWKTAKFKKFNFDAEGVPPAAGALHPLMKVRDEFRNIFFEMGFQEMPTNRYVEAGFWCFDTLFVPQAHPARDSQDTFYVKDPIAATELPKEYLSRVAKVHESGGYGSFGYRTPFSIEETSRLVLRTHTTAISSRMLYELANQPGGFKPAKFFSIDRVFRNEAVDATHLAEFFQVEGVVADYGLTLGDLIGFMEVFFGKMGVTQLRFKPAYNPYTEPSLEIFSWHEGLKRWVEIGNSGVFRPEMLEPMGLPPNVRVHGWGLSLERPTMIKYGISNIRELLGHKVSLESVQNAAAVRF